MSFTQIGAKAGDLCWGSNSVPLSSGTHPYPLGKGLVRKVEGLVRKVVRIMTTAWLFIDHILVFFFSMSTILSHRGILNRTKAQMNDHPVAFICCRL